jgi:hypothetical protein
MKKLTLFLLMLVVMVMLSGCLPRAVVDPLPNTGRGFWEDVSGTADAMVEHHNKTILYNSTKDVPRRLNQTEDKISWIEKLKARYDKAVK